MKVVIWGDSIAFGLGAKGNSYGDLILQSLQTNQSAYLYNFARSKFQLRDSVSYIDQTIALQPDLVIIAHGTTEGIIRPRNRELKRMPMRWQNAQMDPRTYFSNRPWKRALGRIDSEIRWRVKNFFIRTFGYETWSTTDDFCNLLSYSVETILRKTNAQIILVSHYGIDERFFPYSLKSLDQFSEIVEDVSRKYGTRTTYCDVRLTCERWTDYLDDHFHPNIGGHKKIAKKILDVLSYLKLGSCS